MTASSMTIQTPSLSILMRSSLSADRSRGLEARPGRSEPLAHLGRVAVGVPGPNGLVVAQHLLSVLLDVVQGQPDLGDVELIPASQFLGCGPRLRLGEDVVNGDTRAGDLRPAPAIDDSWFHERLPFPVGRHVFGIVS